MYDSVLLKGKSESTPAQQQAPAIKTPIILTKATEKVTSWTSLNEIFVHYSLDHRHYSYHHFHLVWHHHYPISYIDNLLIFDKNFYVKMFPFHRIKNRLSNFY